MTEEKQFYTMQEIADILTIDYVTVYRWIKAGKLKAVKLNSIVRVSKESFDEFINKESKKKRISLMGIAKGGLPITEKDIDEVITEWNKIGSQ